MTIETTLFGCTGFNGRERCKSKANLKVDFEYPAKQSPMFSEQGIVRAD